MLSEAELTKIMSLHTKCPDRDVQCDIATLVKDGRRARDIMEIQNRVIVDLVSRIDKLERTLVAVRLAEVAL